VAGAAFSLLLSACPEPGDLERVDSFCKPGQSMVGPNGQVTGCTDSPATGGSGGSGGGGATACDTACMTALISGTCITCHTTTTPLGALDLQSPGLAARLKDQAAQHAGIDNPQGCPTGDKLIDSANVSASWLLKKITKQQGNCGTPMPPQGASDADIACVTAYVNCVSTTP
jgi:hypothetical protein